MTPGQYLAKRRQAARLAVEDVAAAVRTEPPVGEVDRAGWIRRIEADSVLPTLDAVQALGQIYPFSVSILSQLVDLHRDRDSGRPEPRLCIICGCSEHDACRMDSNCGCSWAGPDTCTRCTPIEEAA